MIGKDESIAQLMEWIISSFGIESIEVVDYWEGDFCAIGVKWRGNKNRLIYISTFGKNNLLYDFECEEYPDHGGENGTDYIVVDKGENITRGMLKSKIETLLFCQK